MFNWAFDPTNSAVITGWSFWLGVIGLFISVIGFAATLWQVVTTKKVAEAAKDEVDRIRSTLTTFDAVQEASKATYAISSARKYMTADLWQFVSDSYEDFRRSLISLKSNSPDLSPKQITAIDDASNYIQRLCERIDRDTQKGVSTVDQVKTSVRMRQHDQLIFDIHQSIQRSLVS